MVQLPTKQMKDTQTLMLTKRQTFWHYSIVPFLLIVPVITIIDVLKYYVFHTYTAERPIKELLLPGYIWLLPAIAFFFIQKQRLKFKTIPLAVDEADFKTAVLQTAEELNWKIESMTADTAVAISSFNWLSWGERITIIRCSDKILFNSICNPDNRPSIASFGMNKKNRKTFEQFLLQTM